MRKYLVFAMLSVFTLLGGTAMAAGLFVKKQQIYYFNQGPQPTPAPYFIAENWEEFDEDDMGCEGTSQVPCHLEAVDIDDLQDKLDSFGNNLTTLLGAADQRP